MHLALGLGLWLIVCLIILVMLISRYKIAPTVVLISVAYLFGLGANGLGWLFGLEGYVVENLNIVIGKGFGNIMAYIGLVIIFGTLIGKTLEKTGATEVIAQALLEKMGARRPGLLMSVMGWFTSIPIFCDSGYVILSSIKKSLVRQTGASPIVLSVSLATGLYASHTFVPPTPGPIAAASNIGLSSEYLIWLMLLGGLVSMVCAAVGYLWARSSFVRNLVIENNKEIDSQRLSDEDRPSLAASIWPILLPVMLMAGASVVKLLAESYQWSRLLEANEVLGFIGHPTMALLLGFLLAYWMLLRPRANGELNREVVQTGLMDAAMILLVTGAGGAFGQVIKATPLAQSIQTLLGVGQSLPAWAGLGLLFFVAALLKSAQGSSTTALVVTSSMAAPLLPILGLEQQAMGLPMGHLLAVLVIGAGAMVVSHVNDSYFWVVTQFSGMDVKSAYRAQTLATLWQGLAGLLMVLLLSWVLL